MPHISKHKVQDKIAKKIADEFFHTILTLKYRNMDLQFLQEFLTKTERIMLAKRLAIVALLLKGVSAYRIQLVLKVSPSTIARIELQLQMGRFKRVAALLKTAPALRGFWGDLAKLFTEGFSMDSKRRSRWLNDTLPLS